MDRHRALVLLAGCALIAAAGRAAARDVSVYGLELEVTEERERLLIFADAPLEPKLLPVDDRTLMVALPGSVLDPTAPTLITPAVQGTVIRVTAFDRAEGTPPEVRVVVQRRPGAPPRVERRASVVALEFEPIPRAAAAPGTINVAYQNVPITKVVSDLARATGESLVFEDSATALGSVTIEGPPRVSRGEALALIDSLLLLRGFAAVPGPGGVRKIVAINGAPSPWSASGKIPDSDAPITTMLRLENSNAADLMPVLLPYLGANATAAVYYETNSLILSGAGSLLRRLRTALQALDQPQSGPPLIWPMRVARAESVADQLLEIAGRRDVPYVSSDPRLNALLLRVRPGETERVRALVDRLDRPARGGSRIQVFKLRYADPEKLAEQLTALRDSGGGGGAAAGGAAGAEAVLQVGVRGLPFEVAADIPTHSLVVSGPPETIAAVLDVVAELDRVPVSVQVDVTVAAVDLDEGLQLGVNYLIPTTTSPDPNDLVGAVLSRPGGGGAQLFESEQPIVAAFTSEPLLLPIFDPTLGVVVPVTLQTGGTITMDGGTADTQVMMRPSLLITSGEEHEIFAGDNVPIPVQRAASPTATGTPQPGAVDPSLSVQQDIERQDVGTTLRVTPTVGERGGVTLELHLEVSSLGRSAAGPVEEVGPTISQIVIDSTIRLRGGRVAVLATAARPFHQEEKTGIPWLMDVPVLGWAFRFTDEQTRNRHLLVAARAQILRPESRELADRFAREIGGQPHAARQ